MHYGKTLEEIKAAHPRLRQGYLEYTFLKRKLKELVTAQSAASAPLGTPRSSTQLRTHPRLSSAANREALIEDWVLLFDNENEKVNSFTSNKVEELKLQIAALSRHVGTARPATPCDSGAAPQATVQRLRRHRSRGRLDVLEAASTAATSHGMLSDPATLLAEADAISSQLVELEAFIRVNGVAVLKIAKKYDKALGQNTQPWVSARLRHQTFMNLRLDGFIVVLSDIFARLRQIAAPPPASDEAQQQRSAVPAGAGASAAGVSGAGGGGGGVWRPPESFERATAKYWVRLEDVTRLKTLIVRHLPVLVFGRDTSEFHPVDPLETATVNQAADSGVISSVYFDGPGLECYHARIRREEGAQLFRVRWYGAEAVPAPQAEVFLEIKTHHEGWIEETSVKERFPLKAARVPDFLSGALDTSAHIDRLVEEGELKPASAAHLKDVAASMQAKVVRERLSAAIRTRYSRTAFQSATSNAVRLSLDTELQLFAEREDGAHTVCKSGVPSSSPSTSSRRASGGAAGPSRPWCSSARELSQRGQFIDFPYAVLEIKLGPTGGSDDDGGEGGPRPPQWVLELLATGMCTPVRKFSKFLTGAAGLLPSSATVVPHWFTADGQQLRLPSTPRTAARECLALVDDNGEYGSDDASGVDPGELIHPQFSRKIGATRDETAREDEGASPAAPPAAATAATTTAAAAVAPAATPMDEAGVPFFDAQAYMHTPRAAPTATAADAQRQSRSSPSHPLDSWRSGFKYDYGAASPPSSRTPGIPAAAASADFTAIKITDATGAAVGSSTGGEEDAGARRDSDLTEPLLSGADRSAAATGDAGLLGTTTTTTTSKRQQQQPSHRVLGGSRRRPSLSLKPLITGDTISGSSSAGREKPLARWAQLSGADVIRGDVQHGGGGDEEAHNYVVLASADQPPPLQKQRAAAQQHSTWRGFVRSMRWPQLGVQQPQLPLHQGSGADVTLSSQQGSSSLARTTSRRTTRSHPLRWLRLGGLGRVFGRKGGGGDGDGGGGGGGGGHRSPPRVPGQRARLVPVKVEPKTLFSLERTYLHYVSATLIIFALSTALLSANTPQARIAGYITFPVAILFICYALFMYVWRVRKLQRKDPTGYHDAIGPWLLALVLICAMVANVVTQQLWGAAAR